MQTASVVLHEGVVSATSILGEGSSYVKTAHKRVRKATAVVFVLRSNDIVLGIMGSVVWCVNISDIRH